MQENTPTKFVDSFGTIRYVLKGDLHRTDGPAVVCVNGDAFFYQYGKLHRGGGKPAMVLADGTRRFFVGGEETAIPGPKVMEAPVAAVAAVPVKSAPMVAEKQALVHELIKKAREVCLTVKVVIAEGEMVFAIQDPDNAAPDSTTFLPYSNGVDFNDAVYEDGLKDTAALIASRIKNLHQSIRRKLAAAELQLLQQYPLT